MNIPKVEYAVIGGSGTLSSDFPSKSMAEDIEILETAKKNLASSCAWYSHENHIINMISCSVPSHNYHLYF